MAKLDEIMEEAVKQIAAHCKTQDDFNVLFKQIKQKGLEAALSGELTDHLGYEKNQRDEYRKLNSRNGYSLKTIQTN
jgi:putative transposase